MHTTHSDSSVILPPLRARWWAAQAALMECLNPEGATPQAVTTANVGGFILEQHWFEQDVALIFFTTVPRFPFLALTITWPDLAQLVTSVREQTKFTNSDLMFERSGDSWLVYDFAAMHSIIPHALLEAVSAEPDPFTLPCAEASDVDTAHAGEGAL